MHALASRLALSSALLAAAAATAAAQPAQTEPAQPVTATPQNADWSQVSNINGQLVPVGQKNDYFYQFKRTNLSLDPVGWIMGFYGVSGSYAIDDHVAIRGELDYVSPPDSHGDSMIEADLTAPIYFRRTYQGVYLEPGLVYRAYQNSYTDSAAGGGTTTTTNTETQWGPEVLVGWHWTWESGLNVSVAAGVGRNMNYKSDPNGYGSSGEQYIPNGYMRFGYAF